MNIYQIICLIVASFWFGFAVKSILIKFKRDSECDECALINRLDKMFGENGHF